MLKCNKCGIKKDFICFSKSSTNSDGYAHVCKSCAKEYRDKNRVALALKKREYVKSGKGKAMYQKYMRKYASSENGLQAYRKAAKKQRELYPEKIKARKSLYRALKRGEIIRPDICCKCNSGKKIEAHHHDYSKPFDIEWLCRVCHIELHNNLKETNA